MSGIHMPYRCVNLRSDAVLSLNDSVLYLVVFVSAGRHHQLN
jgi:hypothetical protein